MQLALRWHACRSKPSPAAAHAFLAQLEQDIFNADLAADADDKLRLTFTGLLGYSLGSSEASDDVEIAEIARDAKISNWGQDSLEDLVIQTLIDHPHAAVTNWIDHWDG